MALSALTSLTIAACFAFALHGCGEDKLKDIVDLAVATPTLSKLVEAVTKADLATVLKGDGPFTVFAPTDAAFNAAYPDGIDKLTKEQVVSLLKYHVISGKVMSADLKDSQTVATLETPKELTITKEGDVVTVGGDAKVSAADNVASNGVVHIIDKVLTVPLDIVDLAVSVPTLSKLVEAVKKADLATVLKGPGPFTVFAPTDDAFNLAYPQGFGEVPEEDLASLLKYHVINGKVMSANLQPTQTVDTLLASKQLTIKKEDVVVTVGGDATVSAADNVASNGVVHIIDKVLTVPSFVALV